jgi:hypothetical protein
MRSFAPSRVAVSIAVVTALLAGCGPAATPSAPGAMPQIRAIARPGDRGRSWMRPEAKNVKRLLYLSDGGEDVYVYDYANGRQVGELTGLAGTGGECVDAKGDVYIANFSGADVVEYARGGTQSIATYPTHGSPVGCAVDKSDDLAAANLYAYSSDNAGAICVWKHGKGSPTCYTGAGPCYYVFPPAYDDKGNLIFEGQGRENSSAVCAILSGGSQITTLDYSGTFCCGGGVAWDGKYVDVTDLVVVGSGLTTTVVQTTLSGTTLTIENETDLADTCGGEGVEVNTPFVVGAKNTPVNKAQGSVLIGSDFDCDGKEGLAFWHYPAGGDPYRRVGFEPEGQVVSIAPGR